MKNPILGAQLYTVRDSVQTPDAIAQTFQKIAKIGYRAVQMSGSPLRDGKLIGKLAADNGLTVGATHVGLNDLLDEPARMIDYHLGMNCRHAAVGWIDIGGGNPDVLRKFADDAARVTESLRPHGIDFSYHNHAQEFAHFGLGRTWLEAMYEMTDGTLLAELDTYWVQVGGGDAAAWIRRYPGRQPIVHAKDMIYHVEGDKQGPRMAPVGGGNMNFPAIVQACIEAGVEFVMVEQDDCYGRDPFECLAESYRNLAGMGLR